jgi:hypothetical protein
MPERLEPDGRAGGHGTRAVIAALLADLGIAVAKFIGFLLTGASSMLAEAFHSVADSGNQVTLLVGGRLARRGPDPRHQFGHGSARYFAAFLVAVVLFTLGSLFSLYEGYQKLRHPHELEAPGVALAILVVAFVLEGLSLRTAVREANPLRGDQSWWSFIRTTKKPELAVVLLEDTAAVIGLSCAFVGVGLAALTATRCLTHSQPWRSAPCWPWSRWCSGSRCTACWWGRRRRPRSRRRSAGCSGPSRGSPAWSGCARCISALTSSWSSQASRWIGRCRPARPPG